MLVDMLVAAHYPALPAFNATDALILLETEASIRLVVTDIRMPEMDGFQMTEEIRANTRLKSLPVIFCSEASDPAFIKKAGTLHCAAYLLKPVQKDSFLKKVGAILGPPKAPPAPPVEPAHVPSPSAPKPVDAEVLRMAASHTPRWIRPDLSAVTRLELKGGVARMMELAFGRLKTPPFSDLFATGSEWFDASRPFHSSRCEMAGRFMQLITLKEDLGGLMEQIPDLASLAAEYQNADGHFGQDFEWQDSEWMAGTGRLMFWGNARLLAGLVNASKVLNSPRLQGAARNLGNFYCNTAEQIFERISTLDLYSPKSEPNFSLCFYAAMEGLAHLSAQVGTPVYLELAERMAARFVHFDALPSPSSQMSMAVYMGALALFEAAGKPDYLARVEGRWEVVASNGCVWPTGAVGMQLSPASSADEGCAEGMWLQLNLRLWYLTGKSRYLSMAQRILQNEFVANQLPGGGFGVRAVEFDNHGAVAMNRGIEEKPCCSLEGAMALHRLKSVVLVGSESGACLNFPVELESVVKIDSDSWDCVVREVERAPGVARQFQVELRPHFSPDEFAEVSFYLRVPDWAKDVAVLDMEGSPVPATRGHDNWLIVKVLAMSAQFQLLYQGGLHIEDRQFKSMQTFPQMQRFNEVILRDGPDVLFAATSIARPTVLALVDPTGSISLPKDKLGRYVTATVQGDFVEEQLAKAIETGQPLFLSTWAASPDSKRRVFVCDVLVVPGESCISKALFGAAERINGLL